jgi:hypothetical protein
MPLSSARLPVYVVRGVASHTVSVTYTNAAGVVQTPSAVTLEIYVNGALVESPVVTPGATSTAAFTETDHAVASRIDFRWTLIIGGIAIPVQRPGYIVRTVLQSVVENSDLETRGIRDLFDLLGASDFTDEIQAEFEKIERRLLVDGKRPFLVLDDYALYDVHLNAVLSRLCYRAAALTKGDATYWRGEGKRLADEAAAFWATFKPHYDEDLDGVADPGEQSAPEPTLYAGGIYGGTYDGV